MSQELSIEYFRNILTSEAKNLTQLCEKWARTLEQTSGCCQDKFVELEEFQGSIRTTIGQAKLLMSQRFKQFSILIDGCESQTGHLPTRLDDLLGFWEMISYQVADVVKKFQSLDAKQDEFSLLPTLDRLNPPLN